MWSAGWCFGCMSAVIFLHIFPLTSVLFALWSCHTGTGSTIKSVLVGFCRPCLVPLKFVARCGLPDGVLVVFVLMYSHVFPLTSVLFALWSCHTGTGSRIKSMLVGFCRPCLVPLKFVVRCGLPDGVLVVWALLYFCIYSHWLRFCSLCEAVTPEPEVQLNRCWWGFVGPVWCL